MPHILPPNLSSKSNLRRYVGMLRSKTEPQELKRLSSLLLSKLCAHPRFVEARNVMLFHSLPDEPSTHELIRQYGKVKNIFLPVVEGDLLTVRPYLGEEKMREGDFHILCPNTPALTDFSIIDLIVVPGVAFDVMGHRLGRGRGYYDRFLVHPSIMAYKIGLCFPFQLFEAIPFEPHDIMMDEVIC